MPARKKSYKKWTSKKTSRKSGTYRKKSASRKRSSKRSVKFSSKKGILKKSSRKSRTYGSSTPRKFKRTFIKRKPKPDVVGAKFMLDSGTVTDPGAVAMYKHSAELAQANLSHVTVRARTAVADVYNCKFRWMTNAFAITPSPPGVAWYGNSIIDSGRTNDNSSCAYVPELGAIYLYYRVTSSKTTIHMQTRGTLNDCLTVVLFTSIIPTAMWPTALPTTLDGWITSGIPHKTHTLQPGTVKQTGQMSMWMSTDAIFNSDTGNEDFSGLMPNGPSGQAGAPPGVAYQWYWGLMYFNYDGTTATSGQLEINVNCEYWTTLDGPVTSSEYTPAPKEPEPEEPVIIENPTPVYPILKDPEYEKYLLLKRSMPAA